MNDTFGGRGTGSRPHMNDTFFGEWETGSRPHVNGTFFRGRETSHERQLLPRKGDITCTAPSSEEGRQAPDLT